MLKTIMSVFKHSRNLRTMEEYVSFIHDHLIQQNIFIHQDGHISLS